MIGTSAYRHGHCREELRLLLGRRSATGPCTASPLPRTSIHRRAAHRDVVEVDQQRVLVLRERTGATHSMPLCRAHAFSGVDTFWKT
jgi:hypothetical protein